MQSVREATLEGRRPENSQRDASPREQMNQSFIRIKGACQQMAEKLNPPPQSSAEELAGLDPAGRDAVLRAEEDALIAYARKRWTSRRKLGSRELPLRSPRACPFRSR